MHRQKPIDQRKEQEPKYQIPQTKIRAKTEVAKKPVDADFAEIIELREKKKRWEERRFADRLFQSEQAIKSLETIVPQVEPIESAPNGSKPVPIQRPCSSARIVQTLRAPANSPIVHSVDVSLVIDKLQVIADSSRLSASLYEEEDCLETLDGDEDSAALSNDDGVFEMELELPFARNDSEEIAEVPVSLGMRRN